MAAGIGWKNSQEVIVKAFLATLAFLFLAVQVCNGEPLKLTGYFPPP